MLSAGLHNNYIGSGLGTAETAGRLCRLLWQALFTDFVTPRAGRSMRRLRSSFLDGPL